MSRDAALRPPVATSHRGIKSSDPLPAASRDPTAPPVEFHTVPKLAAGAHLTTDATSIVCSLNRTDTLCVQRMLLTWPTWIGRFCRFRVLAGLAMKTFLRLFAASLFVGQFGNHSALAEPPRVSTSGLFSDTSDEPESVITLLEPLDNEDSILLISGQARARKPTGWRSWMKSSASSSQPAVASELRQPTKAAGSASTAQSLNWNSLAQRSRESAPKPVIK